MPVKSVREMSERERWRRSLAAKLFHNSMLGCILLGAALLLVGLGLYGYTLTGQYIERAYKTAQQVSVSATHGADSAGFATEVMRIYRSLSAEERAECGTEAYRARFPQPEKGGTYDTLLHMLAAFIQSDDVSDVYLAMYDEATGALVYVVDPDKADRMYPGEWESVSRQEINRFLNWDGTGMLYDADYTKKYGWMCTAGVPIRNDAGEVCVFLLVDVTIDNVLSGMRAYALQITLAALLVTALLSVLLTRRMQKTLVRPLTEITEAAQQYVKDRQAGVRDADHFASLNIRTGDEVENLSLVMADMERDLAEYEDDLTRITAEKERISTELSLAARIQADMLPNIFPPFPDRAEFDVYASMDPAKEVGGDFYDYFLIDDDHLCLVMADVSGKGVPAALFMMASKIILANNAMMGKSPARILTDTNAAICSNNRADMFVTVWLGILEISTGRLTAANAGHEYPAFRRSDGGFELLRDKHGFVVGGMEGVQYREYELQLAPGARLFVYTDGVPEATDADGGMFGTERMLAALNETPDAAPGQLLQNVRRAVDGFVRDAEQFDDLTMLCLEYRGSGEKKTDENG